LLAEEAKPTERCSVFVEPVSVLGQIQIDETYAIKCYTSGTRHEAEEGDGGWPEPKARTRPHERTDETKRNRQRNRLEVSDACSE